MASAIGTLSPSSSFEPIVGAPVELVDGKLAVDVEMVEHLGAETFAYARYGTGELLTIAVPDGRNLKAGDHLAARFPASSALLFDADGMRVR